MNRFPFARREQSVSRSSLAGILVSIAIATIGGSAVFAQERQAGVDAGGLASGARNTSSTANAVDTSTDRAQGTSSDSAAASRVVGQRLTIKTKSSPPRSPSPGEGETAEGTDVKDAKPKATRKQKQWLPANF